MDLPGEKLVLGLWNSLAEKGVGGLLRPWHLKRVAKAEGIARRDALLFLTQAEEDAARIRRGEASFSLDGELVATPVKSIGMEQDAGILLDPATAHDSTDAAKSSLILPSVVSALRGDAADTIRKEINVSHAILKAEDVLRERADQETKVESFDEDWLFRWRELAGQVSKEQIQELWGRVLAGEAVAPGAYSLRTLEFLRAISEADAALIAKVAPFMLNQLHCANHKMGAELVQYRWVAYADLLELEALGLVMGANISGHEVSVGTMVEGKFIATFEVDNVVIVVTDKDPARRFTISGFSMTALGKQIMSLWSGPGDSEYIDWVATSILEQGFDVMLGEINDRSDGMIRYKVVKKFPRAGGAAEL